MNPRKPRFSVVIHRIRTRVHFGKDLQFRDLVEDLGEDGHPTLIAFLSIPFLQPIPLWGVSTAIGLCIAVTGFFWFLQKPPYVPQRLGGKTFKATTVESICAAIEKGSKKIEKWIRPRCVWYSRGIWPERVSAAMAILLGLALSLPLPVPLSNSIPAIALLLLSAASLESDGVVFMLGVFAFFFNLLFFGALILSPLLGWHFLSHWTW